MTRQPTEGLTGTVRNFVWKSGDGKYLVARLIGGEAVAGPANAGPQLLANGVYHFHGRWDEHHKYGRRFVFDVFSAVAPPDEKGVIAYLQATADKVGPVRALHLWKRFGPDAVRVLREQPEEVAGAGIMSLVDAREAALCLHHEKAFEDLKVPLTGLLSGRGFQTAIVIKEAVRLWRGNAVGVIRRNPHALMLRRVPSCGFTRCDQLYKDLGLPCGRLKRQTLCLWHWLRTEAGGHTWVACERAGNALAALVGEGADPRRAMKLGKRAGIFRVRHEGGDWIADASGADNERRLADSVRGLLLWAPPKRAYVEMLDVPADAEIFEAGL